MFSDNLKSIREARGLTKAALSRELGIPYTTYDSYERGSSEPKIDTLQKIATALDTTVEELIWPNSDKEINTSITITIDDVKKYKKSMLQNAIHQQIPAKSRIINAFDSLNTTGQQKAVDNVEDLAKIPEYQKEENANAPEKDNS